jgi:hypothetical protein
VEEAKMKNHRLAARAAVALLCLVCAREAAAEVVNCNTSPSSCTAFNPSLIGGSNPYVYIQDAYFSDTSNTYFDPANPAQISYNFNNGAVSEKATGSLATGITGVYAQGFTGGDLVNVVANDIFTLNGPSGGGPVNITAVMHAAGTASLAPRRVKFASGGWREFNASTLWTRRLVRVRFRRSQLGRLTVCRLFGTSLFGKHLEALPPSSVDLQ